MWHHVPLFPAFSRWRVQIVVYFRFEAGEGLLEIDLVLVRPGRRIDGPDLRHGLVHHVEERPLNFAKFKGLSSYSSALSVT